jgi:hypothetical protein
MDDNAPDLGPCCCCERTDGVRNVITLHRRGVMLGRGWGCVVCGLACDGAIAVLCDDCLGKPLRFACRGYPGKDGRVPISELPAGDFDHDPRKHSPNEIGPWL